MTTDPGLWIDLDHPPEETIPDPGQHNLLHSPMHVQEEVSQLSGTIL